MDLEPQVPGFMSNTTTPSGSINTHLKFRLGILILGTALFFVLRRSACHEIYRLWITSDDFKGLPLAIAFAGMVLWNRRKRFFELKWKTLSWALVPLFVINTLQMFGRPELCRPQIILLLISIALLTLSVTGWQAARHIAAPLFLTVLSVPPPEWLWQEMTLILQYISFKTSTFVYSLVAPISAQHLMIFLYNSRQWIIVAEECSGARSLLGLCIVGWPIILRAKVGSVEKFVIALSVPLIAFCFNLCRILLTIALKDCGFDKYANGFWHGISGVLFFLLALLTIAALLRTAEKLTPDTRGRGNYDI